MDAEDRAQFEENRAELMDRAWRTYTVLLTINEDDGLNVQGTLTDIVEFYRDYRSEIEEVM